MFPACYTICLLVGAAVGTILGGIAALMLARFVQADDTTEYRDVANALDDLFSNGPNSQKTCRSLGMILGAVAGAVLAGVVCYQLAWSAYVIGGAVLLVLAGISLYEIYKKAIVLLGYVMPFINSVGAITVRVQATENTQAGASENA